MNNYFPNETDQQFDFLCRLFVSTDGELNGLLMDGGAISGWAGNTYESKNVAALKLEIERFDAQKAAAKDTRDFIVVSKVSGRLESKLKQELFPHPFLKQLGGKDQGGA